MKGIIIAGSVALVGVAGWFFFLRNEERMAEIRPGVSQDTMMQDEAMIESKKDIESSVEKDAMMKKDAMVPTETVMEKKGDQMMEKEQGVMMADKRYVEYGSDILEKTKNTRRILFFYASWCPNCKPVDAELQAKMSEIPADVTIVRVNYNDPQTDQAEKDLATQYGVTYQHTFVQIDMNGTVVTKWNGGTLADLLKNIK